MTRLIAAVMRLVAQITILLLANLTPLVVDAKSSLPPCGPSSLKHNCFGEQEWPGYGRYVGEFLNGKPHGEGIEYTSGFKRSGRWENGSLVAFYEIDPSRFNANSAKHLPIGDDRPGLQPTSSRDESAPGRIPISAGLPILPACSQTHSASTPWHNCIGEIININNFGGGWKFVGVFRNGQRAGYGIEYDLSGKVIRSGEWSGVVFQGPSRASTTTASSQPTANTTASIQEAGNPSNTVISERERLLLAEVEAERKRRLLAEQRLEDGDRPAIEPQRQQQPLRNRIERRIALVIGNSAYRVSPLENPANDAADMDTALKRAGFQTTLVRNATLAQIREATRRFADQLPSSDVALIYFAGHGIESNRKNYLIPVNADLKFEYELAEQAYDASVWLDMLESVKSRNADRVNIVVLDACRNNTLIGARSLGRGLGRMDAPTGTFLAYSTAPGKVAADGGRGDRNSPFTRHLLRAMQQPGLPIEEVFKEVRRNVSRETGGAQVPWESTSLTGHFSFQVR